MAEPRGRMRRPDGQTGNRETNLAWSALFVVVSVVGGLAAADIAHESTRIAVLFSLLVALIAVLLLYMGMLDETRAGGEHRPGPVPRQGPGVSASGYGGDPGAGGNRYGYERTLPGGFRDPGRDSGRDPGRDAAAHAGSGYPGSDAPFPGQDGPPAPVQSGPVRLVQSQPGGGSWWEGHVAARSSRGAARDRGASRAAAGPRKVDLSQFLDQALIAQCPRCGAFRIDVNNRTPEWLFECQECGQRWTWQPGSPWPAVQVRPEARGRTDRPRA